MNIIIILACMCPSFCHDLLVAIYWLFKNYIRMYVNLVCTFVHIK